jgi:hypothetical protein
MSMTSTGTTLKAWAVWEDAREAISDFSAAEENMTAIWRVKLMASVALLRAIGHVLDKADRKQGGEIGRRIQAQWPAMKANPTFIVIDELRNSILKLYEFGVDEMTGWEWTGPATTPESAPDAREHRTLFVEETNEAATDTLWRAWQWWGSILAEIEHGTK